MRVLTISNLYPPAVLGGYELGCAQAVEALRRRGHEVLVLTTVGAPLGFDAAVDRSLHLVDVYDARRRRQDGGVDSALREAQANLVDSENVSRVAAVIGRFRPDVVYLWNLVGVGGLGIIGIVQHLAVPWTWHLMDCVPRILCTIQGRVQPGLASTVTRLLRGTYITCSRSLVAEIEEGGIRLGGPVAEISNWIDGRRPADHRSHYRGGHLRMAFAGQIAQHKGVHILVGVAAQLRDWGFTNFSIDLFGHGRDDWAQRIINDASVASMVRLAGSRPQRELVEMYSDFDVFLFPTWGREPYGFAPLEAQARGCVPLVSADCGYSEWFVDQVHCLKAERNVLDFALTVRRILEGQIRLEPIARRGADVAWRDFHVDTIAPRIEAVLDDAVRVSTPIPAGSAENGYRLARIAEQVAFSAIADLHAAGGAAGGRR